MVPREQSGPDVDLSNFPKSRSERHGVFFLQTGEVGLAFRETSQVCMAGGRASPTVALSLHASSVEPVCVY